MNGCGARTAQVDLSTAAGRRRSAILTIGEPYNGVRSFKGGFSHPKEAAMSVNFLYHNPDGSFGPGGVYRSVSRLLFGHRFGAIPAPYHPATQQSRVRGPRCCGSSLFCFGYPPHHATSAFRDPGLAPPYGLRFPSKPCSRSSAKRISPEPP
jgi:hypothetical protein